jgi:Flp pilus assembly protein TadD
VTAWIGLAASYDRLGRFDLADQAYAAAAKLEGSVDREVVGVWDFAAAL